MTSDKEYVAGPPRPSQISQRPVPWQTTHIDPSARPVPWHAEHFPLPGGSHSMQTCLPNELGINVWR
jgi:hypothetical protein